MPNEYFNPGTTPANNSPGSSATMRSQFTSVETAFGKLPVMATNQDEIVTVNGTGTALIASGVKFAALVSSIVSADTDKMTVDSTTPAAPILSILTNSANGIAGLDSSSRLASDQMPINPSFGTTFIDELDVNIIRLNNMAPTTNNFVFEADYAQSMGIRRESAAYNIFNIDPNDDVYFVRDVEVRRNLEFTTAVGARITGDFSGTFGNRVLLQTSTLNGGTGVGFIPNGTSNTATLTVCNDSAAANGSLGNYGITATEVRVNSTTLGAGSLLPIRLQLAGVTKLDVADALASFSVPLSLSSDFSMVSGARIGGDFSNATLTSRTVFKSTTVNGSTVLTAMPNGTNVTAGLQVYNADGMANCAVGNYRINSTAVDFVSSVVGSGTQLPLRLLIGATARIEISTLGIITMSALPALNYVNDAAAAAGGVPVGGLYNTAGAVKVRLV